MYVITALIIKITIIAIKKSDKHIKLTQNDNNDTHNDTKNIINRLNTLEQQNKELNINCIYMFFLHIIAVYVALYVGLICFKR